MFIHTNQPLITSFYIEILPNRDESALIRNFLRNGRVRGKPIGRVKVKPVFFTNVALTIGSEARTVRTALNHVA